MQTSRLPLAVFLVVLGAACSSPNTPSTTSGGSGGGNGTGNANGSGNATGNGPGGSVSGANGGSSSGGATGTGGEDPIGTQCSKTGNTDYMPCSTTIDCMCPGLYCALDPILGADDAGGSICTRECKVTADCPDIFTSCQDGLCTTNLCEADGGGGAFMGPCDAEGTGDGTCEPTVAASTFEVIGACFQAGTVDVDAGGRCDANQAPFILASPMTPNKKRPAASVLCPVGYECVNSTCQQLCDPVFVDMSDNDAGGCLDGKTCVAYPKNTPHGGHCSIQGDGGCLGAGGGAELDDCGVDSPCDCPLECEIDEDSLRHVCEKSCKTTADCDVPYTSCQRPGICDYNYCVQTYYGQPAVPLPDAGSYTGPCNYAGIGDGLCEPYYAQDMFGVYGPFGYCEPAGTVPVGGMCGAGFPPFCGPNEDCQSLDMGQTYNCYPFCQPFLDGGNGGCAKSTDGCFTVISPPLEQAAGICLACSTPSTGCYNSPECCDGYCAYAQPDAGNGFCN